MKVIPFTSVIWNINSLETNILFTGEARLDSSWRGAGSKIPVNRLYLVKSGEAVLKTKTDKVVMRPGMAYLVPADAELDYGCDSGLEKIYIHFNLFRQDRYDLLSGFTRIGELPLPNAVYSRLLHCGAGSSVTDTLTVKHLFFELLTAFLNQYGFERTELPKYSDHVMDTIAYIHHHLSAKLRLEELAKNSYVSRSYLTEQFRKEVGVSLGKYIDDQLLAAAQLRLSQTSVSICEISRELGFSDQCYFARWFKRSRGVTPTQYRRRSRI